jgi:hypothetical protein
VRVRRRLREAVERERRKLLISTGGMSAFVFLLL